MRITRATPDDLDALIAFRDQAAAWLASRGIDQWQEPWPTEDLMVEGMRHPGRHHHHQPLGQAGAVDRGGAGRAGAVRPQGHR
jgi:hypothetical protein